MIPEKQAEPYLELLHRALVLIRMACQAKNNERAEAIADAVHELPLFLRDDKGLDDFSELYIDPLSEKYPDLVEEFREILR